VSPHYEYCHTVRPEEIDPLGHVNNVAYVDWMQSAALAHSTALGWPGERYRRAGCGWVVRSHTIEYLLPALAGDKVVVRTWVATMRKATSLRRYEMYRAADGSLLAKAETLWAFVDYATGQPRRIPREIADAYPLASEPGAHENHREGTRP